MPPQKVSGIDTNPLALLKRAHPTLRKKSVNGAKNITEEESTKEKCFYGDKEGWDKVEANKPTPLAYFTAYHDTASTPRSYFKDRPENFREVYSGSVITADNKAAPVKGIGSVKFGDLELKEVAYVPSFSKNLVSGIQIMKQGYKQVIDQDLLQVFKNNELVATGHYDEDSGLIKMNNELTDPIIIQAS